MAEDSEALRARRLVLARRARFVAAALAGSGLTLASPVAAKPEDGSGDDDAQALECGKDASERCSPQICLSDIDIEGELVTPPPPKAPPPDKSETAGPLAQAPPVVCLSIAPPSADLPRQHDGFYLRLSLMPTLISGAFDAGSSSNHAGFGVGAGLAAGITLLPGGVVGLSLRGTHAPEATGNAPFARTTVAAGPMFVFYPDQRGGLFVGGAFEVSGTRVESKGSSTGLTGLGAALWLGYDLWINDDFSFGTALHADFAWARGESQSQTQRLFARNLALAFSIAWH